MHGSMVVRLSRFRTSRPSFDAVLRTSILPALHAREGMVAVFAGRQGPDEIGVRVLVTVRDATTPMDDDDHDDITGPGGPLAETTGMSIESLPAITVRLAAAPLQTGILRIARGRLVDTDLASFAEAVTRESESLQAGSASAGDFILAASGEASFVMFSTWPDWAAIEAATGASVRTPIRTKRLATLEAFEADHFELVSHLASATD